MAHPGDPVLETQPLGFPWVTVDPFLFCVHHDDAYPAGNDDLGPAVSLEGRDLGQDFAGKDGFRMYHGDMVPGFPQHPHRGFETVTIVRRGVIDHSDSLGATARFGSGDVQWLTAGAGIVHSEMFPLLRADAPNPLELFQIWLNLPAADKHVRPYFTMAWDETIPRVTHVDAAGRSTSIAVIAGPLEGVTPPPPPPNSWAARPENELAIWSIRLESGAEWTLPPARHAETVRTLYFFHGTSLSLDAHVQRTHAALLVATERPIALKAGDEACDLLMLQGRPIGEPIAQHGPFVMNSREEIAKAFEDYRATAFGGWPHASDAPVHDRDEGRFARHADGRLEKRGAR